MLKQRKKGYKRQRLKKSSVTMAMTIKNCETIVNLLQLLSTLESYSKNTLGLNASGCEETETIELSLNYYFIFAASKGGHFANV